MIRGFLFFLWFAVSGTVLCVSKQLSLTFRPQDSCYTTLCSLCQACGCRPTFYWNYKTTWVKREKHNYYWDNCLPCIEFRWVFGLGSTEQCPRCWKSNYFILVSGHWCHSWRNSLKALQKYEICTIPEQSAKMLQAMSVTSVKPSKHKDNKQRLI